MNVIRTLCVALFLVFLAGCATTKSTQSDTTSLQLPATNKVNVVVCYIHSHVIFDSAKVAPKEDFEVATQRNSEAFLSKFNKDMADAGFVVSNTILTTDCHKAVATDAATVYVKFRAFPYAWGDEAVAAFAFIAGSEKDFPVQLDDNTYGAWLSGGSAKKDPLLAATKVAAGTIKKINAAQRSHEIPVETATNQ